MKYCSECGASVSFKIPENDDRPRYVCDVCETIHYQNPLIVCGCIPEWQDKVLLCKRAIEPRSNYWTLPAGFMELNETTMEGAIRETWEEARAKVELLGLYCVFNLPYNNQVHMMFRAKMLDEQFAAGPESTDVGLYSEEEIPWDNLAFATIRESLRFFYKERKAQQFTTHMGDIIEEDGKFVFRQGPENES